jgi:hypothetical protein
MPMDTAANTRGRMQASSGRAASRTIKAVLLFTFALITVVMAQELGETGVVITGVLWLTLLLGRWTLGKW